MTAYSFWTALTSILSRVSGHFIKQHAAVISESQAFYDGKAQLQIDVPDVLLP